MSNLTDRYRKNMNMLSPEENQRLRSFKVCVVGCGGLGGYIIELLGRLGIGHITAIDGDVFDATNLNRQLLSTEALIGQSKAMAAKARMEAVNSDVTLTPIQAFVTEDNAETLLKDHDVIVDALDSMNARRLLEKTCEKLNVPMVHGAISGWYGQVATILPGNRTLEKIYPHDENKGIEVELGNPSFTPALVASVEVSEVLKVLLKKGELLSNKLLTIDLLNHEYDLLDLF